MFEQQDRERRRKERAKKHKKDQKKKIKLLGQMFLSTQKTKTVHANKDNIEYYNKLYEDSKSA